MRPACRDPPIPREKKLKEFPLDPHVVGGRVDPPATDAVDARGEAEYASLRAAERESSLRGELRAEAARETQLLRAQLAAAEVGVGESEAQLHCAVGRIKELRTALTAAETRFTAGETERRMVEERLRKSEEKLESTKKRAEASEGDLLATKEATVVLEQRVASLEDALSAARNEAGQLRSQVGGVGG